MGKNLNYILLFFSLTLLTSCFEIVEEINLNADGSGSMLITFNLSKSKSKLASLMLLDSVNGYKVPSKQDINNSLKEVIAHLNKTKGITNINKTTDFDNYIFSVSYDFENVSNINAVFEEFIHQQNKNERTNFSTVNFSYNLRSKVFKRHFSYDNVIKKSFFNLKNEDRRIIDDASYICIYRFKEVIKSISNSNARISPNKKAVMLRVAAMSLVLGEKNVENEIQLIK